MKETHAGGLVINPQGKVLLVHQRVGTWSFPKGHIKGEEDAFVAAKREIEEETGISDLEYVQPLGVYQRHSMDGKEPKNHKDVSFQDRAGGGIS